MVDARGWNQRFPGCDDARQNGGLAAGTVGQKGARLLGRVLSLWQRQTMSRRIPPRNTNSVLIEWPAQEGHQGPTMGGGSVNAT